MALIRRDRERRRPELIDRALTDWPIVPLEAWRRLLGEQQVAVEEFTENGQIVVRAELPGADPDRDIDVSIDGGNLRIRAERRDEKTTEGRNYRRSEIRYGSFTRTVPLPIGTKEDQITASYKDGILEVRAPLDEGPTKRPSIPIRRP